MARAGQIDLFTRRVRQAPPTPEFNTTCAVADTLRVGADPAWQWWHYPAGELRPHDFVKGKRVSYAGARLQRMGVKPGLPDFHLISPTGLAHFLELKRERGGRVSKPQEQFGAWCLAHKVPWVVAKSYDEAIAQLKAWGVLRVNITVSA